MKTYTINIETIEKSRIELSAPDAESAKQRAIHGIGCYSLKDNPTIKVTKIIKDSDNPLRRYLVETPNESHHINALSEDDARKRINGPGYLPKEILSITLKGEVDWESFEADLKDLLTRYPVPAQEELSSS